MAAISSLQSHTISSSVSSEPMRSDSSSSTSSSSSSTSTSSTTDTARSVTLATQFLLNPKRVAEVLRLEERLKGKRVMIAAQPLNDGYGDYIAARDMIRFFHQVVGLPKECLSLAIGKPEDQVSQLLQLHTFTLLDNTETAIKSWNPDYIIFTTCENTGFAELHGYNKPCLAIAEAGYPALDIASNIHSYAMGLGPSTLGMFMNPEVRAFAISPAANDPLARLAHLKQLPESFQKAILGSTTSDAAIEAFYKQSKLYSGYAHEAIDSLYPAASAIISADDRSGYLGNHVFCFIGNALCSPSLLGKTSKEAFVTFENACLRASIGSIEYVNLDKADLSETIQLTSKRKTVKLITGNLPEQYVSALTIASEFEQVTTGDSSFAATFPKLPLYEIRHHKSSLWTQYQRSLSPELWGLVDFYERASRLDKRFDQMLLSEFLFKIRNDPKLAKIITDAMKTIAVDNDCIPRLVEAMHKLLDAEPGFKKEEFTKLTLPNVDQLTGNEIPFDKDIFLDLEGVLSLRLSRNGISGIDCYRDSTFTYKSLQGGYMIRRHKKKS